MKYFLKTIENTQLQAFFRAFSGEKTFLQGENWKIFREKAGETAYSVGIFTETAEIIGIATLFETKSRRGRFFHVPHGPLIEKLHLPIAFEAFLDWYKAFGRQKKADYIRISPLLPQGYADLFKEYCFQPAIPYMVNPERTLTLDITPNEDEILAQMKKTTRYEVKQGLKKEIKVTMGNTPDDFAHFWALHAATVARQGFTPFAKAKTELEMAVFGENCQIFTAFYDEMPLSSSLILFDEHSAYYHQGASLRNRLPAPAATLWAAILEAKKRNLKRFNFWGLSERENKAHPWFGLSQFKRGFGGSEHEFVHAHDFALTGRYFFARIVEKYRRWKRKY